MRVGLSLLLSHAVRPGTGPWGRAGKSPRPAVRGVQAGAVAGSRTGDAGLPAVAARKLLAQGRIDEPLQLLRSGDNHVFRAGDAVLRLSPLTADPSAQMALAARLEQEGVPVLRGLADLGVVDGMRASLWELVDSGPKAAVDYEALGRAVARLHSVPAASMPPVVRLPWYADAQWLEMDGNLERAAGTGLLDDAGLGALRRACDELRGWAETAAGGREVGATGTCIPTTSWSATGSRSSSTGTRSVSGLRRGTTPP